MNECLLLSLTNCHLVEQKERLKGPPEGADVKLNIRDRYNDYRGYISGDGSCYNNVGDIIGRV